MTGDFEQTARLAESGDFVYLDPPYSAQRPRHGEYGYGSFDKSDESRLLVLLHDLDLSVLISLFRTAEPPPPAMSLSG
jgi:site-specific DNA-adenine methylase